ncbi:MAG: Hpt domain-containing protein [Pseudomonadota bacterium]
MAASAKAKIDLSDTSLPVMDLNYLRAQTFGNLALEVEILELFLRQSTRLLLEFTDATPEKDWRDYARALKASAQNIGALRVSVLAAELEDCARDKGRQGAKKLLDAFHNAVSSLNDEIRTHLKNFAPAH